MQTGVKSGNQPGNSRHTNHFRVLVVTHEYRLGTQYHLVERSQNNYSLLCNPLSTFLMGGPRSCWLERIRDRDRGGGGGGGGGWRGVAPGSGARQNQLC